MLQVEPQTLKATASLGEENENEVCFNVKPNLLFYSLKGRQ